MKYQLVLQFSADSMADFDRVVALETKLIEKLDEIAVVDGHDFGLGKFAQAMMSFWVKVSRTICDLPTEKWDGEDYIVLWPSALKEFSVL
jgi:hypothetical protein